MEQGKKLSIGIFGTRGIPANYGGFETFAEELSTRLVTRGHKVTVYGRRPFFKKGEPLEDYRGVGRVVVPTIMHKYAETPIHSLMSFLTLLYKNFDVILLCNAANSPFAWMANLRRIPIAINVDGIERKRSKWNALGRLWYFLGEHCSVWFGNRIISDAFVISDYYEKYHKTASTVIRYGADPVPGQNDKILEKFGLTAEGYLLYVSRLEPENNALGVIEAYTKLKTEMPLVVVGDAPYADEYKKSLYDAANANVIFTGYQFGEAYRELRANCYIYIQATEVGGTHPALVEAMAYGNCIVANGVPEHLEVLCEAGEFYWRNDFEHLAQKLELLLDSPDYVQELKGRALQRSRAGYQWDKICDSYEKLLRDMVIK